MFIFTFELYFNGQFLSKFAVCRHTINQAVEEFNKRHPATDYYLTSIEALHG